MDFQEHSEFRKEGDLVGIQVQEGWKARTTSWEV